MEKARHPAKCKYLNEINFGNRLGRIKKEIKRKRNFLSFRWERMSVGI